MAFRILSLLLWLLIGGPLSLPAHALARPETRVGELFPPPLKSAADFAAQPVDSHQAKPACGYDFASGVHKYLYAHNDPVNMVDPSGHMSMGSFTVTMSTWGIMAANLVYRAAPALNRATVILFEATTGNSIFVGGSGAVLALSRPFSKAEQFPMKRLSTPPLWVQHCLKTMWSSLKSLAAALSALTQSLDLER